MTQDSGATIGRLARLQLKEVTPEQRSRRAELLAALDGIESILVKACEWRDGHRVFHIVTHRKTAQAGLHSDGIGKRSLRRQASGQTVEHHSFRRFYEFINLRDELWFHAKNSGHDDGSSSACSLCPLLLQEVLRSRHQPSFFMRWTRQTNEVCDLLTRFLDLALDCVRRAASNRRPCRCEAQEDVLDVLLRFIDPDFSTSRQQLAAVSPTGSEDRRTQAIQ
ncbi:hypothetical protein PINS_up006385 [Pythium insidiosum]|nr:hypothetical protein PINS_up006385 [Pythium insidiosum]